jgi:hypothetical protein
MVGGQAGPTGPTGVPAAPYSSRQEADVLQNAQPRLPGQPAPGAVPAPVVPPPAAAPGSAPALPAAPGTPAPVLAPAPSGQTVYVPPAPTGIPGLVKAGQVAVAGISSGGPRNVEPVTWGPFDRFWDSFHIFGSTPNSQVAVAVTAKREEGSDGNIRYRVLRTDVEEAMKKVRGLDEYRQSPELWNLVTDAFTDELQRKVNTSKQKAVHLGADEWSLTGSGIRDAFKRGREVGHAAGKVEGSGEGMKQGRAEGMRVAKMEAAQMLLVGGGEALGIYLNDAIRELRAQAQAAAAAAGAGRAPGAGAGAPAGADPRAVARAAAQRGIRRAGAARPAPAGSPAPAARRKPAGRPAAKPAPKKGSGMEDGEA